jgi:hypothetical protein
MKIRSGTKCALATALGLVLALTASGARANGRFPRGEHLFEFPSDPNHLLLAATYGLVTTNDRGKNWYYVCETAFSHVPAIPGFTGDPLLALTADESILAGVTARVTRSTDAACGWTKVLEEEGKTVDDIAVAPSNRNIAVALVRTPIAPVSSQIYETTDGGATWKPIGTPITNIVVGYTIDIDPKDPAHLMVTGITDYDQTTGLGVFLNSTNRGMTWTTTPIPKTNVNAPPYIAAVHPTDAKVVFVRTDEWPDNDIGGYNANDALFYTKDGGQTWTELLRPIGPDSGGKLFAFALSPDGATALAGYGDPVDSGGRRVDPTVTGIYRSSGPDYSFGVAPKPTWVESITCLTWTARGVYACGAPGGATNFIGFASDPTNLTSAGFTRIMDVANLKGQPPCCAGRAVTTCDWAVDCTRFETCGNMPPAPDSGICMMPDAGRDGGGGADGSPRDAGDDRSTGGSGGNGTAGAGTAGASGTMGGAGRAGAGGGGTGGAGTGGGGTGGAGGTGGGGTGGAGGSDDGCNCRTAGASQGRAMPALSILLGLVGAIAWRGSRRRKNAA